MRARRQLKDQSNKPGTSCPCLQMTRSFRLLDGTDAATLLLLPALPIDDRCWPDLTSLSYPIYHIVINHQSSIKLRLRPRLRHWDWDCEVYISTLYHSGYGADGCHWPLVVVVVVDSKWWLIDHWDDQPRLPGSDGIRCCRGGRWSEGWLKDRGASPWYLAASVWA